MKEFFLLRYKPKFNVVESTSYSYNEKDMESKSTQKEFVFSHTDVSLYRLTVDERHVNKYISIYKQVKEDEYEHEQFGFKTEFPKEILFNFFMEDKELTSIKIDEEIETSVVFEIHKGMRGWHVSAATEKTSALKGFHPQRVDLDKYGIGALNLELAEREQASGFTGDAQDAYQKYNPDAILDSRYAV
jgi:hypothetical protein